VNWTETPTEVARAWAEQPVVVPGPHGDLYGIFTPPASEVSPAGLCVILLGRNRWWVDRLSVRGARWLATRGFACLRFDYHGFGESEGTCEFVDPESPYPEDVVAAIRFMREQFGQQRFVLSGFCFDARTALSAVMTEGSSIEAIVAVAVPPGDKLTHVTMSKVGSFLRLSASAKKSVLSQALRRRLYPFFPSLISHPEKRHGNINGFRPMMPVSENFKRDLQAIIRFGVRCLFLNGREDAESYNFKLVERYLLAKLDSAQRAAFTLETWPNKLHITHDPDLQHEIAERMLSWIDGLRQTPLQLAEWENSAAVAEMANDDGPPGIEAGQVPIQAPGEPTEYGIKLAK
jgi:alpha/beta superfamily hydrolase